MNEEMDGKLGEIEKKVDALWATRKQQLRVNNAALGPLLHEAHKIFEGRIGRPAKGAETFTSWLEARGIPRATGYRLLDAERMRLGELNRPTETITDSDGDEAEGDVEGLEDGDEAESAKSQSDATVSYQKPARSVCEKGPAPVRAVVRSDLDKELELAELEFRKRNPGMDADDKLKRLYIDAIKDSLSAGKKKGPAKAVAIRAEVA